jgi:hypothetical protein
MMQGTNVKKNKNFKNFPLFFNHHKHEPENINVTKIFFAVFIQHAVPVSLCAEKKYVASSYTVTICMPQSQICK